MLEEIESIDDRAIRWNCSLAESGLTACPSLPTTLKAEPGADNSIFNFRCRPPRPLPSRTGKAKTRKPGNVSLSHPASPSLPQSGSLVHDSNHGSHPAEPLHSPIFGTLDGMHGILTPEQIWMCTQSW